VIKTVLFDLDGTLYDRDFLVRSLAERRAFESQTQTSFSVQSMSAIHYRAKQCTWATTLRQTSKVLETPG
jgi:FMN phosphatase YigB (HAD superfamily)